ncbi:MAG: 2Fe-2S iron-sulfur cluster binding domain-containing protein [Anaerolineae bacterium]|nr:2Fe-2S iron-sulfur cluster binding domain-containing protein [Anaerolineae bacterium]
MTHSHSHSHAYHQSNSHILVQEFDYFEPSTLREALALREKYQGRCSLVAGGTHLLIMMKMEREHPEVVININNLPELNTISKNSRRELVIGACNTIYDLRHNAVIRNHYPALSQACQSFGSTQIQIMGTIGGNLCNGSPASDTVPALLIYDARLSIANPSGTREIPVRDFLLGPGKINLNDDEILTSIILPPPPENAVSAFIKVSRVAADLAKANIAMLLVKQDDKVKETRISFGSVSPTVIRVDKVEEFLKDKKFSVNIAEEAGKIAAEMISPIDDVRSNAWYRRELASVMTYDLLNQLWNQSPQPTGEAKLDTLPRSQTKKTDSFHLPATQRKEIQLTINGVSHQIPVAPNELLVNVLREKLQLTGTKYGCGLGECSACSVHLDGKVVLSCLLLAVAMDGREITTIEGLQSKEGDLDPIQEAFIEHSAFQCGYCTPGIIMTVKGLINENPVPSEDEVRDYLKGNRCRCTGYISIARAVMAYVENQQSIHR